MERFESPFAHTWRIGDDPQMKALGFVTFLLENGAPPDGYLPRIGLPLMEAANCMPIEYVRLLLRYAAVILETGALQKAIIGSRIEILDCLLQHGADINIYTHPVWGDEYVSNLHFAAYRNFPASTAWLLKNGADVSIRDSERRTALDWAMKLGHWKVVWKYKLHFDSREQSGT